MIEIVGKLFQNSVIFNVPFRHLMQYNSRQQIFKPCLHIIAGTVTAGGKFYWNMSMKVMKRTGGSIQNKCEWVCGTLTFVISYGKEFTACKCASEQQSAELYSSLRFKGFVMYIAGYQVSSHLLETTDPDSSIKPEHECKQGTM